MGFLAELFEKKGFKSFISFAKGWVKDSYNPFDSLMDWKGTLMTCLELPPEKRVFKCDFGFVQDHMIPAKEGEDGDFEIPILDFLAMEIQARALSVKNMQWMTEEDFRNDPNPTCPICGSTNLTVD